MAGSVLAASDWSIFDENAWLGIWGLLAVAAAGLVGRLAIQLGPVRLRQPRTSTYALAYLAGGAPQVLWAALAGLRARGCLSVDRNHLDVTSLDVSTPPADADDVELAVHLAVSQNIQPPWLATTPG